MQQLGLKSFKEYFTSLAFTMKQVKLVISNRHALGRLAKSCFIFADSFEPDPLPCAEDNEYGRHCPEGSFCKAGWKGPAEGLINFDNILYAIITVFQCITMEGWTEVLYYVSV